MQICPAYQLSGLSVLICIKLIKLYKNEIIQKIRAKRESGLTAVWLKRDPPVDLCDSGGFNNIKAFRYTGPMVSKAVEILQEENHREEPSFTNTVYCLQHILTQFIHHGYHNHITSQSLH